MHPHTYSLLFACAAACLIGACGSGQVTREVAPLPPPNIVFIMTDDHALEAISVYGSRLVQTPNIDRIAREGVLFKNSFVTNSICAPSRAVLLTGKYSHLNGLRDNRDHFDGAQQTFPKLLQEAGYRTAIIGKWHLKTAPTGFDYWNILNDQGEYYNPQMIKNGDTLLYSGYTTDLITDLSLEWLEQRDTSRPFCLLYHHKAPHRNWMPNTKHLHLFQEDLPLPETFWDDYATRSAAAREQDMRIEDMFMSMDMKLMPEDFGGIDPGSGGAGPGFNPVNNWLNDYRRLTPEQKAAWDAHYDEVRRDFREKRLSGKALAEWKYQRYIKDYLRCIVSVDENIGRLLDFLGQKGLSDNTIVIYTSDQGFYLGEHGWYDKRFMYEESLRMPLVLRYPAMIKPGAIIEAMALNLDFAPTFLDFAGVSVPEDMQGRSLRPLLIGATPADWRREMYYHYYEYPHGWHSVKRHEGIRDQRYKLIHFYHDIDAWELYDLDKDPTEVNNVYDQPEYAAVTAGLKVKLDSLRAHFRVPDNEDLAN
jgi:arylsulfatase A-like enzyme